SDALLKAAKETVKLLESAINSRTGPTGPLPLMLSRGGQVVEVAAQPAETIESGQTILRVERFDRVVARVTIPAGDSVSNQIKSASIAPAIFPNQRLSAHLAGMGGSVDSKTQGQTYLFSLATDGLPLRPGMAVIAYIDRTGEPLHGVIIPRDAVIRAAGQTWVYIESEGGKFSRVPVTLGAPVEGGWFCSDGPAAGASVVTIGSAA